MPPRTRGTKTKSSKENIGVVAKNKLKTIVKVTSNRKALADKTNSASDDNSSTDIPKKIISANVPSKDIENIPDSTVRPRRDRKLPNRFQENLVLINLSNSTDIEPLKSKIEDAKTPVKNDSDTSLLSPFKTPQKNIDNSLITNRPKRVCRLPSRFDDHSISPNKFIPVGCHASTPIVQNKTTKVSKLEAKSSTVKATSLKETNNIVLSNKIEPQKKPDVATKVSLQNKVAPVVNKSTPQKKAAEASKYSSLKKSLEVVAKVKEDTNNNGKRKLRKTTVHVPIKSPSKIQMANYSFKVLEEKKKPSKRDNNHLDVYEFTYDPTEEPPPQKKKRKKVVKKKPPKPKTVILKSNYDNNLTKALAALKNVVTKKPPEFEIKNKTSNQMIEKNTGTVPQPKETSSSNSNLLPTNDKLLVTTNITKDPGQNIKHTTQQPKNTSTRVEDIAADFEPLMEHNDFDYSPVNSPNRRKSSEQYLNTDNSARNHDPLNFQNDMSFFNDPPVASSSMNMSVRKPHDSPWRVEFEQLPIKWHVNTYVKSNMTPAVESSFINFDDIKNKKKHVYTNIIPDCNDEMPEILDENQSKLKQTSIISFFKEAIERRANKKRKFKSITPTKSNSIFGDVSNLSAGYKTPKKTPRKEAEDQLTVEKEVEEDLLNNHENTNASNEKKQHQKSKSTKKGDNDGTYFGFDESGDQENVSPVKVDNPRVRALRPRGRAVLQEINALSGPLRAKIPLAAKTKIAASSEAAKKIYEDMKSAEDAPVFQEKDVQNPTAGATDVDQSVEQNMDDEDAESVHLFEDIELVHHLKVR
jgi:hypothetical protein